MGVLGALLVLCLVYSAEAACPHEVAGLDSFASLYSNPTTTTDVVITTATLLDVTALDVNTIVISGSGQLIFNTGSDITIRTKSILVKDNGQLIIGGSAICRFTNKVNIALHGTRTTDRSTVTGRGEKFIVVEGNGSLKIFGQDKIPWTKLTSTVPLPSFEYRHQTDSAVKGVSTGNEGLAMTVFDSSLVRQSYAVYDLWKDSVTNEQKWVGRMVTALGAVTDGQIVAIALQNYMKVSVGTDLSTLFSTLESVAGLDANSLLLRTSHMHDAFALVFKKGSTRDQAVDELIGKGTTEARACIEVTVSSASKKLCAVSTVKAGSKTSSFIDVVVTSSAVGNPVLSLAHDVQGDWLAGDRLVIATTDFSLKHTEVRTITGFPTTNSVKLDHPLMYRHYGAIEQGVDMRAEVGLLTRNIRIYGEMSRDCPPENENCGVFKYYDTYGCHIKVIESFAHVHIEGVEIMHCGQPTDMGFYPIHFHMCENITGLTAVVKHNSIHDTFQRAITIHGTYGTSETQHGVLVFGNVAYNINGHCYFTEDGSEKATVFKGNLAVSVNKVTNSFNFVTDAKQPTAFWITTPEVVLIDNVAAGSEGTGFWWTFPISLVGPSASLSVYEKNEAAQTKLMTVDNNVAHSCEDGFNFDNILDDEFGSVSGCMRYNPRVDPLNVTTPVNPAYIYRTTAFKNRGINAWVRGGGINMHTCSMAESKRGIQLASGGPQHQYVTNCVILGESQGNHEYIEGYPDAFGKSSNGAEDFDHYLGIVFYDGPVWISNSYFDGFKNKVNNTIVAGALGFNPKNKFLSSITSTVTNLRFGGDDATEMNWVYDGNREADGVNGFGNFDGDEVACFRDADGSVVKCPGYTYGGPYQIHKPEPFIMTNRSVYRDNWKMAWTTDMYCKLSFLVQTPKEGFNGSSQMRRVNSSSGYVYEDCDGVFNKEYMAVLNRTDEYHYQFQYLYGFPDKLKIEGKGVARDEDVVLGVCLPAGVTTDDVFVKTSPPDSVMFDNSNSGIVWVDDLAALTADTTMSRALLKDRFLYIHLTNRNTRDTQWDKYDDDNCPGGSCPSFVVEFKNGVPAYEPCFTVPDGELDNDVVIGTTESCTMTAGTRDSSWGVGDTLGSTDGSWREWGSWSECCNTAGQTTTQTRTRTCTFPTPHGPSGNDCPADDQSTQSRHCPVSCPVDGTLLDWSRWGDCSCQTGSAGVKERTRICEGTAHGGEYCRGTVLEVGPCNADCP